MQLTKSAVREVRGALVALAPGMSAVVDELLPRGESLYGVRLRESKSELCVVRGVWVAVRVEGRWLPSLHFLQRYPHLLPRCQVDRGAVPHVLNGANVMAQGLLSPGGALVEVEEGVAVLVFAEGKVHPLAVALTLRSAAAIRAEGRGPALRTLLVMGDELWDPAFLAKRK